MSKKRICIYILAIMMLLTVLLGGCEELRQKAIDAVNQQNEESDLPELSGANDGAEDVGKLPTLPKDKELIPLDVIMGYVEYTTPQISRDGSKILYRHMTQYEDAVIVEDWATGDATAVRWPNGQGNPYYNWAPDDETVLFFIDDMGDENYGLYTSNIKTGKTKTILEGGTHDVNYAGNNPDNDKEIYIVNFNFDTELHDVYLLNYETGDMTLILENPGDAINYMFDHAGNLRLMTTTDDHAGVHIWAKLDVNNKNKKFVAGEWKEIFSWDYEDAKTSGVVGFMQDNKRLLYLDTSASNTSTLYTYDIDTGESQKVYNDPDYEIAGSWTDMEADEVVAVNVYSQKIEWEILDESFQDDYDALAALEDGVFDIYDSSENDEYWLVAYLSDTKEMDYYVYEMDTHETTYLYNARDELEQYDFAPKEPISFTASDGLDIEGYVTFPLGEEKKDLPTVVLVHGGPWARDTWEYDSEVQFLADRGYMVLQVNFRGSTGYGKDFILAGDKEWGRAMHQDILDAVQFAIDQGWTDKDRVGIYGASYGGYEALVSAAFSSDVFQCAVDAFGPSSLLTFVESLPPQWSTAYQDLIRSIGDPKTESEMMKERSPLYYADDIEIPMLIAQGANDVRVVQQESDQMVEALKKAGVPVKYMLFPNTGHGFNSHAARQKFYSEMEAFFAEYLGGRTE